MREVGLVRIRPYGPVPEGKVLIAPSWPPAAGIKVVDCGMKNVFRKVHKHDPVALPQAVNPFLDNQVEEGVDPPNRFVGGVEEPEVKEGVFLVVAGRILPVDRFQPAKGGAGPADRQVVVGVGCIGKTASMEFIRGNVLTAGSALMPPGWCAGAAAPPAPTRKDVDIIAGGATARGESTAFAGVGARSFAGHIWGVCVCKLL